MKNSQKFPRFLVDRPEAESAQDPHKSIGHNVARLLMSEDSPRVIALCGEYGSGKSTVVECMRQSVVESGGHVYVFDAWAHRGAALQRSFLEGWRAALCPRCLLCDRCPRCPVKDNATDACEACGRCRCSQCVRSGEHCKASSDVQSLNWLESRAATRVSDSLLSLAVPNRPVRASRESLAKRDRRRAITAGLTLAVAIGAVVASSEVAVKEMARLLNRSEHTIVLAAVALMVLPAVLVCTGLLWPNLLQRISITGETDPQAAINPADDIRDEPPTMIARSSLDAERVFLDIATSARRPSVGQSEKREEPTRLIIVLDNLDRLSKSGVQQTWVEMRIFAKALEYSAEAAKRVRFVVPYSPQLKSAFDIKVFQARFDVPPMTMLQWEKYFQAKYIEAFGEVAASQIAGPLNVVRSWIAKRGVSPTPREIIRLINDIVAIEHSRGLTNDIPIDHIVYYAIDRLQRTQEQIRASMFDERQGGVHHVLPDIESVRESDKLSLSIAKLLFGVHKDSEAAELTLGNELNRSIMIDRDEDRSKELGRIVSSEAFWPLMDQIKSRCFDQIAESVLTKTEICGRLVDAGVIDAAKNAQVLTETDRQRVLRYIGERLVRDNGESHPLSMPLGTTGKVMRLCHSPRNVWRLYSGLAQQMGDKSCADDGHPNPEFQRAVEHMRATERQLEKFESENPDIVKHPTMIQLPPKVARRVGGRLLYLAYAFRDEVNAGGYQETRATDARWMRRFDWELQGPEVFFTTGNLLRRMRSESIPSSWKPDQSASDSALTEFMNSFAWRHSAMMVAARHNLPCNWGAVAEELRQIANIPGFPFYLCGNVYWALCAEPLSSHVQHEKLRELCPTEFLIRTARDSDTSAAGIALSLLVHWWDEPETQASRSFTDFRRMIRVPGYIDSVDPHLLMEFNGAMCRFAPKSTLIRLSTHAELRELWRTARSVHESSREVLAKSVYEPFNIVPSVYRSKPIIEANREGD